MSVQPFLDFAVQKNMTHAIRCLLLIAIAPFYFGCANRPTTDSAIPQTVVGVDPESKEPRFVFIAPDGFNWNNEHGIFYSRQLRASIGFSHASGKSFESVVDDFVAEHMRTENMEMVSKDVRDVDGRATLVVRANRLSAKYPQETCTVVYPTSIGVAQITAIYPAKMDNHIKVRLESALTHSRYDVPE